MAAKVWMLTGASRGIGAEIAKAVLAAGDHLAATSRNVQGLDHLGTPENLWKAALDVTDEAQVKSAVNAALQHFGRIDVLVNNAGYGLMGTVEECAAEEVERQYRTNVFGLLHVTRAVLPGMRKRRAGHIMNISSDAGYQSRAGWGLYASTKFAVEGISEALHAELAPLGIFVTAIEPGFFRTDFLDRSSMAEAASRIADYDEIMGKLRELAVNRNHLQPGDPAKLARAVVQLANEKQPPLRLALGPDTVQRIIEKNAFVESELAKWRSVSVATDYSS